MKKIILTLALMMATLTVAADNILYFTYNQAARTVACLNHQDELMIYCGYEDELPTYVLINEVWAEQISSSFYEIWLYGYDAYTGDEIYMPIDLECIYLMQNRNIYSAAQYLRFKYTHRRPTFSWAMPPYNPFVRAPRPVVYYYTYHYDIHRPGWHYHSYPHMHYHPYYRRLPHHPAPMPPKPFTPGQNRPGYQEDPNGGFHYTNEPLVGKITTSRSQATVQNDPTQRNGNRITSNRTDNTITVTDRATGSRNTTPAPSRTGEVSDRGSNNSRSGISTDNSGRGNSSNIRSSSTRESGSNNSRSGVSTDNSGRGSSTNRSGISSDNSNNNGSRNNSTKESNSRSTVSSDNSRTNTSSSRSSATKESDRSSSSRSSANSSSSRSSNTKESDRGSSSRSAATTNTRSSNTSRSGNATTSSSSSTRGTSTSSRSTSSNNNSRGTTNSRNRN